MEGTGTSSSLGWRKQGPSFLFLKALLCDSSPHPHAWLVKVWWWLPCRKITEFPLLKLETSLRNLRVSWVGGEEEGDLSLITHSNSLWFRSNDYWVQQWVGLNGWTISYSGRADRTESISSTHSGLHTEHMALCWLGIQTGHNQYYVKKPKPNVQFYPELQPISSRDLWHISRSGLLKPNQKQKPFKNPSSIGTDK